MTASVRVIGVPALAGRFARAAVLGQVAVLGARDVLGEEIAAAARRDVAVDTGETRDSIGYADGVVSAAGAAVFLEYGTSDTAAQPFMRPAADTASADTALAHAAQIIGQA